MKTQVTYIILLICLIIFFINGSCSDYTENLGNGYFYRHEGGPLNDIHCTYANGGQIHATVIDYDYDGDFIVAKQKPDLPPDPLSDREYEYKFGVDVIYFWIIVKKKRLVLGPFNMEEFNVAKDKYKVPNDLTLK
ncbi:MAG: DUF3997 domain-containing protein [Ignavibacteria bacterium]